MTPRLLLTEGERPACCRPSIEAWGKENISTIFHEYGIKSVNINKGRRHSHRVTQAFEQKQGAATWRMWRFIVKEEGVARCYFMICQIRIY
jgi:hypothetical protein